MVGSTVVELEGGHSKLGSTVVELEVGSIVMELWLVPKHAAWG